MNDLRKSFSFDERQQSHDLVQSLEDGDDHMVVIGKADFAVAPAEFDGKQDKGLPRPGTKLYFDGRNHVTECASLGCNRRGGCRTSHFRDPHKDIRMVECCQRNQFVWLGR